MADVKVESLRYHTTGGKEYYAGATYVVDESAVENLVHLGMVRVGDAAAKATRGRKSTAVKPMTTASAGLMRRGRPPRVQPRTRVTAGPKK